MTGPDRDADLESEIRKAALAVVVKSYENYKDHARFQETQRSWFLVPYMGIVGVVGAAILNRLLRPPELDDPTRSLIILTLVGLIFLGVLLGAAIVKVGVAFQRHYDRAERIVLELQALTLEDRGLQTLLALSRLPTTAKAHRGRSGAFIARRGSVAAMHTYLISFMVGIEAMGAVELLLSRPGWSLLAFLLAAAWTSYTFSLFRKLLSATGGGGSG